MKKNLTTVGHVNPPPIFRTDALTSNAQDCHRYRTSLF